jgi:hypothetical protein
MPRQRTAVPAAATSLAAPAAAAIAAANGARRSLDAKAIAQLVVDAKAWLCRQGFSTWGGDKLFTHPLLAAAMAMEIDPAPEPRTDAAAAELRDWTARHPDVVQRIHLLCHVLMSERKEGHFHPSAPSPATRAARTRRRVVRS